MRSVARFDPFGPSAVVASLCIALALAPAWVAHALAWDRAAISAGECWRLWTGHVVHYSLRHALLDTGVLMLLGWTAELRLGRRYVTAILLLGMPLLSVALCMFPTIEEYRGASGLATLLGALVGVAIWRDQPQHRAPLAVLAAIFLAKIACDAFGLSLTLATLPPNVGVAWQVHLLGVVMAGVAVVLRRGDAWRVRYRETRSTTS